jgi:hypothetical protein
VYYTVRQANSHHNVNRRHSTQRPIMHDVKSEVRHKNAPARLSP